MNQKVLAQRAAQKKCDHAAGPDKVVFRSRPKPAPVLHFPDDAEGGAGRVKINGVLYSPFDLRRLAALQADVERFSAKMAHHHIKKNWDAFQAAASKRDRAYFLICEGAREGRWPDQF